MNSPPPPVVRWMRAALGLAALGGLILFSLKHGEILGNIDPKVLAINIAVSVIIVSCNSLVLQWTTRGFDNPLTLSEAALITALGGLANSAGGLPIGTALGIGILVKQHHYRLSNIVAGKLVAAALATISFSTIAAFSWMLQSRFVLAALAIAAATVLTLCLYFIPRVFQSKLERLIDTPPLHKITGPLLPGGLLLSLLLASLMVIAYWTVTHHYLPSLSFADTAIMASLSLLLGLGLMAGLLPGLQEVIIGMSGLIFQVSFTAGVELGLFIRLGSLVACAVVLAGLLISRRLPWNSA